jgi:hypothetical protein
MRTVGYSFLKRELNLNVFEPRRPARTEAVLRVIEQQDHLAIPESVAPAVDATLLEHLLFALKHEGIDLQVLSQAMRHIPAAELLQAITASPGGAYIRRACYLWEAFAGQRLENAPQVTGAVLDLFDPKEYVTLPGTVEKRWRVNFNGLGSLRYCPVVRLTERIQRQLGAGLFERIHDFASSTDQTLLDRAVSWAYLSETDGSFAIEKEAASAGKRDRFVRLLERAHEGRILDESYLVELQNATIDSPIDLAIGYRQQQNRLVGGTVITYMPPPPDLGRELMGHLLNLANSAPREMHPVIAATLSSFGFVFIHPFMDGNGRISRFLFHKGLCDSGQLPRPLLLPVSVALKKHEDKYLAALKSYSLPARAFWTVGRIADGDYDDTFNGSDAIYRYWDATVCVELGFDMAEEALEKYLSAEVQQLQVYDRVKQVIDEEFDVRGSTLAELIFNCLENGNLSKNKRKKYADAVKPELFDRLEAIIKEVMAGQSQRAQGDVSTDQPGDA